MNNFMDEAIFEAYEGINNNHGGPFGSVIVKNNIIIGRGHNQVLLKNDPTCHGEIEAIRDACKNLKSFNLSDCILYTTAEPCPMCLGAILWSNIKTVFYGCTKLDTAQIGFRDDDFYSHFSGKKKIINLEESERSKCLKLFEDYKNSTTQRY